MLSDAEPELRLVIECVRAAVDPGADPDIEPLVSSDLDWDRVLDLARYHGVLQLLQQGLASTYREVKQERGVPPSVSSRLDGTVQRRTMRNLAATDELRGILDDFDDANVRALPFKGPVLSAFAYDSVTVREYNDLDFLVHPEDVSTAADVLEERGYEWRDGAPRLDDAALLGGSATKAIVHEYAMTGSDIDVELRWRVGDAERPFSPDVTALWDHREQVDVGGASVPALAPEDRLLVLAFHGTKHRWYLLKWLCDFVAAMDATTADWDRVLARARDHGVERPFLVGAALAGSVFEYGLPEPVATRVSEASGVTGLADRVRRSLASGSMSAPGRIESARFFAAASESPTALLRLVALHSALHPTYADYRFHPLPGHLHPLYYVVWPLRLLAGLLPDRTETDPPTEEPT
ncbi:nucleotidyltransferase domain-containing protein [Haloarcula salina]|uniref:Nucleotidyltransferase family protein n=1 Tax=Haloarcula salina TaxID=1429914 RepID=A0AA41KHM7_9EURY|nr:nucleotidyltransferase family protein [Haloarcula salina]MBV0900758.1 nucleotidyltransferase family protein [Haloarcula salina]